MHLKKRTGVFITGSFNVILFKLNKFNSPFLLLSAISLQ